MLTFWKAYSMLNQQAVDLSDMHGSFGRPGDGREGDGGYEGG